MGAGTGPGKFFCFVLLDEFDDVIARFFGVSGDPPKFVELFPLFSSRGGIWETSTIGVAAVRIFFAVCCFSLSSMSISIWEVVQSCMSTPLLLGSCVADIVGNSFVKESGVQVSWALLCLIL